MRQLNILNGTKGFVSAARYGIRLRDMVSDIALKRVKILSFWETHGLTATVDAFGVKRSTLFLWKAKLNAGGGRLESLNTGSRAPKRRRTRVVDPRIAAFIVQERRQTYHRLGKEKIQKRLTVVCQGWGIPCPSPSTVGRILSDLKKQGRLPHPMKLSFYGKTGLFRLRRVIRRRKKMRRNGFRPNQPGDLLELDTVVKFVNGVKRYLLCAVDLSSHFAFAYGYASLSSSTATDFFKKLTTVAPFPITRVQTDNGQEFERYFRGYLESQQITHFHNYPKCPKMNAVVERFNRTIQEEHVDYHLSTFAYDLPLFNRCLMEWLIWYNTERPHWSEGLHPPLYAIAQTLSTQKSNMLWTDTLSFCVCCGTVYHVWV